MCTARPLRSLCLLLAVEVATAGVAPRASAGTGPTRGRLGPGDRRPSPVRTASVEGHVEISRALGSHRPRFRIYAEAGPGALPPESRQSDRDELQNVILYVERAGTSSVPAATDDGASGAAQHAVLRQHGERFTPHVLPVMRGTTVDFVNDDDLFHNVFSLSRTKEFDLGRYPRGSSKSAVFDRPGVVQVFCHIHSDMSALVLVLDNPYFAAPDAAGRYVIPNLPAGDYTVVAWHERIRPIPHRMHLEPGQAVQLDFTIPLPAADAAREH